MGISASSQSKEPGPTFTFFHSEGSTFVVGEPADYIVGNKTTPGTCSDICDELTERSLRKYECANYNLPSWVDWETAWNGAIDVTISEQGKPVIEDEYFLNTCNAEKKDGLTYIDTTTGLFVWNCVLSTETEGLCDPFTENENELFSQEGVYLLCNCAPVN